MTEKQIKKLKNGLENAGELANKALEKLGNAKEEIDLANRMRHFAEEASELVKAVKKLTPSETPQQNPPKAKRSNSKSARASSGLNNVEAYLRAHPEAAEKRIAKGTFLSNAREDDREKNTTCRHYCGDYCDIGMDMTFCSKRCAYCTNMPGSSKAYA